MYYDSFDVEIEKEQQISSQNFYRVTDLYVPLFSQVLVSRDKLKIMNMLWQLRYLSFLNIAVFMGFD